MDEGQGQLKSQERIEADTAIGSKFNMKKRMTFQTLTRTSTRQQSNAVYFRLPGSWNGSRHKSKDLPFQSDPRF